jgi:hypothetical protein
MKHTRKKSNGMKRYMLMLPFFLVAVAALILGVAAPNCWADDEPEFEEADCYAELNDTDGDLGFHCLIDGEAYSFIKIWGPRGRDVLKVVPRERLKRQGLTELFFESAEPTFDELSPEQFFRRFREGDYNIKAILLEGGDLLGEDFFWHVMPAQPGLTEVDGVAVDANAENDEDGYEVRIDLNGVTDVVDKDSCDDEEDAFDPTEVAPDEHGNVVISWEPVTTNHPTIGRELEDDESIVVARYQGVVEVEIEIEVDGETEEFTSVFSVDLPPDQTSFTVPASYF